MVELGTLGGRISRASGVNARAQIVGGLVVIMGHNYSCWLRFRGGKGIATSAGVLTALIPMTLLVLLAVWGLVFAISRYVSMASITVAVLLPLVAWWFDRSAQILWVTGLMAIFALYAHRSNIRRLWQGTEHRFGSRLGERESEEQ
jgi:glycerol-3-phosphate acyltransferase PlsY